MSESGPINEMQFRLDWTNYYIGFWYVAWPGGNWLCGVWREKGDAEGTWRRRVRIRLFADDKDFGSQDVKAWEELDILTNYSEEMAKYRMDGMRDGMMERISSELPADSIKCDYLDVRGNGKLARSLISTKSWASVKKMYPPPPYHA